MSIRVTCACGKTYSVKDELAGRKVRCPQCQAVIKVPNENTELALAEEAPAPVAAPVARAAQKTRPAPPPVPPPAPTKPSKSVDRAPLPSQTAPSEEENPFAAPAPPKDDIDAHLDSHEEAHDGGPGLDQFDGLKHVAVQMAATTAASAATSKLAGPFRRNVFLLRQKHWAINEKYYVWDEKGNVVMFVERPRHFLQSLGSTMAMIGILFVGGMFSCLPLGLLSSLNLPILTLGFGFIYFTAVIVGAVAVAVVLSPLRHIFFYTDDTKQKKLLEVKQVEKMQIIFGNFQVEDPEGRVLARLQKNHLYNFIRRRWYVLTPDGKTPIARAMEDSLILSILRRVLPPIVTAFLRTNFIIVEEPGLADLGVFNRKFTILDRYVLDMSKDVSNKLDRRVALALGVLLDTGERR